MRFRSILIVSAGLMLSAVAVATEVKPPEVVVLAPTPVVCEASRATESTNLLPLELSAVRLRRS